MRIESQTGAFRYPEGLPYSSSLYVEGVRVLEAWDRGVRALDGLGYWLLRIPMWLFVSFVGAVGVAKATFIWKTPNVEGAAPVFPQATSSSDMLVGIGVVRLVQGNSWGYFIVTMVALVAALVIVWRAGRPSDGSRVTDRIRLILAIAWPFLMANLAWFGHGSEFLVLFVAMAVLLRSPLLWVLGTVGASLTHPTQAFATFVGLLVLTWAPEFRALRLRAVVGTSMGAISTVGFSIWMSAAGVPSRIDNALEVLLGSILNALRHGILGLYSGWGVWWVVVLAAFVLVGRRGKVAIIVSGIVFPVIGTMVGWDGTRNFVAVAGATGLAFIWLLVKRDQEVIDIPKPRADAIRCRVLGIIAIAFLVLPNVVILMVGDGVPRPGWMWVGLFENYLLPRFG